MSHFVSHEIKGTYRFSHPSQYIFEMVTFAFTAPNRQLMQRYFTLQECGIVSRENNVSEY